MREILTLPIKRGTTPITGSRITSRLKRRFIAKRQENLEAWLQSKHHAIDKSMLEGFAMMWGVKLDGIDITTNRLAKEHEIFANKKSPEELEEYSSQTVVGVGYYKDEDTGVGGYPLVFNTIKRGLGFPGGRVRIGQSPLARLFIEIEEETGLISCPLSDVPFSDFFVTEDEDHSMSAYPVEFTGGQPMARPTEEEPIEEIVFVRHDILLRACQRDERINTLRHGAQGILSNHRKVFLDFVRSQQKVVQEVVNV